MLLSMNRSEGNASMHVGHPTTIGMLVPTLYFHCAQTTWWEALMEYFKLYPPGIQISRPSTGNSCKQSHKVLPPELTLGWAFTRNFYPMHRRSLLHHCPTTSTCQVAMVHFSQCCYFWSFQ